MDTPSRTTKITPPPHNAEIVAAYVRAHRDAVLAAQQAEANYPLGAKGRAYRRALTTLAQEALTSSDDVPALLNTIEDLRRELAAASGRCRETSASQEQDCVVSEATRNYPLRNQPCKG